MHLYSLNATAIHLLVNKVQRMHAPCQRHHACIVVLSLMAADGDAEEKNC